MEISVIPYSCQARWRSGLRSTPRPDPFDVIASAAASKPSVPKSKKKRKNPTKREDVKVLKLGYGVIE